MSCFAESYGRNSVVSALVRGRRQRARVVQEGPIPQNSQRVPIRHLLRRTGELSLLPGVLSVSAQWPTSGSTEFQSVVARGYSANWKLEHKEHNQESDRILEPPGPSSRRRIP
ncbi:hypothetical protein MES5069_220221 [Mesorhizobium escarrei]|uniref:Uncharacterized protein n=1 Tax=Mesorhizobium escarrei TaxID=666018 RepID=A0ABM9DTQ0_9HYPH|nr:hypothetical protein MES5069_220221 [Mesorhizobium escarrei]